VKLEEVFRSLMGILHSKCSQCSLRMKCIENECHIFRIEKVVEEEMNGVEE
jgi:hypothetical protein